MYIKIRYKNKTHRYDIKSDEYEIAKSEILNSDIPNELKSKIKSSKSLIEMSDSLEKVGATTQISISL